MDPLLGLHSMQESRAMKAARSKNKTQETKLLQEIQALDMHIKSRSGKLINQACDTRELMARINDAPKTPGATSQDRTSNNGRSPGKSRKLSMTLAEFDRRMQEKRDRARRATTNLSNPTVSLTNNKQRIHQSVYSILPAVEYNGDIALYRKKHTMKDAWNRANSEDIKYRQSFHKTTSSSTVGYLRVPAANNKYL